MANASFLRLRPAPLLWPALAGLLLWPAQVNAQQTALQLPREVGVWVDDSGSGAVEIYVCADRADRLCGRIVWLKEPLNAQGVHKRDRFNPNAALQSRSICGLPVLGNLAQVSEGGFDGGWIYDPKVGKSYDAAIQLAATNRLVVTGYVGVKLLSKSFNWNRAPEDLVRCQNGPATAQPIKGPPAAAPIAKPVTATTAAPDKPKAATSDGALPSPPAPKPAVRATADPMPTQGTAKKKTTTTGTQAPAKVQETPAAAAPKAKQVPTGSEKDSSAPKAPSSQALAKAPAHKETSSAGATQDPKAVASAKTAAPAKAASSPTPAGGVETSEDDPAASYGFSWIPRYASEGPFGTASRSAVGGPRE